ncbi:Calx-beta domain-containing protein, partial [Arenibacter nanhaiticus]
MEHSISIFAFKKSSCSGTLGKLFFLGFFLLTSLSFAQQADLRSHVTEGQDCTSNDVQLISAQLSSEECTTCSPGDILVVDLLITVRHNTNSVRPSLAVFGDLTTTLPDGSSTTSVFTECGGPIIPKDKVLNGIPVDKGGNGIQTIKYGQVSYICGSKLEVDNILVAWTVPPDGGCPIADASPHPKCGFQEGSLIIIPPLHAIAEAFCTPENYIDLEAIGGSAPYTYDWKGPNGFTSTDEDLFGVLPGNYDVTVTDSKGCSINTSVTKIKCCEFFATPNLDSSEQNIEGCDVSDLPSPFTDPENVFTDITENPCGNLIMHQSDILNGNLCTGGLIINRTYTLFDDLNNNNTLDSGEEFAVSYQNFRIIDTTLPTFNTPLPEDSTAAFDNIPSPPTLSANDNCDDNVSVTLVETYIGDSTSTTYTIVRTWTASDCAGNETVHTQYIYVTENGDPIGLKINDVTVDEADNTAVFTVTLTGRVSGGFNVDYNSVNQTAIAPNDFTAIGITSLSFSGNHGEKKTISVSIKEDQFVEDDETFTIDLSNLSTTEIPINKATGTGTIIDNDSATISITDMEINEGTGIFNIQVTLIGKTQDPFTINFSTADGSAIKVDDYVEAIGQITFPANSTNGTVQNISLEVIDDNIIEFTENFLVNLNSISGFGDISFLDNQANIDIIDNDAITGTGISFDNTNVIVNEDAGTAIFTVRLTGQVFGGFTLDYTTENVTAMAGSDYTAESGKLNFAGNDNEFHTIEVPIIDDTLIEPTETFVVNLSNIDPAIVSINTAQARGTIKDNDATAGTGVSFKNTDITVNEDAGTATFKVVLSGNVQGGFTLDYTTDNGSAVQPDDYTLTYDTLTFVGNDGETKDITVPIIDDLLIEPTENFFVKLSNLSTSLIGINTPQAKGNIIDNDAIAGTGIAFTNTNVTVTEGTDAFAIFEVTLTGDISENVSVDYTTIDGTALDPSDYLTTTSTITFTPTIKSYEIQVPIMDDAIIEPSEAFTVELSNIQSNLGIGFVDGNATNTATGNILDDDAVGGTGIAFTYTNVTVTEGTDAFA